MMCAVLVGNQAVSPPVSDQHGRDVTTVFLQHSDDIQHLSSPVSLRAAFVSSPRYHRNTCPANLATAGHECIVSCHRNVTKLSASPPLTAAAAAAADELVFDAPELVEETLLDVSHSSAYLVYRR